MVPAPSAFSMPPIRCSRPAVPGIAHGRARVSGSRRYGQNSMVPSAPSWLSSVAKLGSILASRLTSGTHQGSDPFARYPSESKNTGVRYVMAILAASIAAKKQSDGDCGATMGTGASPLRPNMACRRSDCSVFVGSPVDGPPRCTSTTSSGNSSETASPIASDFKATPGPEVVVTPSAPPYEAPIAAPTPAISSSA